MFKVCDSEVVEPLPLIYKNYIDSGISPDIKKILNIYFNNMFNIKILNILLAITILFLYYQFAAKYLNVQYTILLFYTWKITSCLLHINQAFTLMTHAYIS